MPKLYELRIGNFFEIEISHEKKKIKKVAEIKTRHVLLDGTWYSLDRLISIPITQQILLQCGFVQFGWIPELHVFQCDYFKCKLYETGLQFISNDFKNTKTLQYLHELQNLYVDLTGKELIMNANAISREGKYEILSGNI